MKKNILWVCALFLLFGTSLASAQWVAFWDYVRGSGTSNTVATVPQIIPNSSVSVTLTNVVTGTALPISVTLNNTTRGVQSGGASSNAFPGTSAYNTFNGFVDFKDGGIEVTEAGGGIVSLIINGLNPNKTYSFIGTAVRGGHVGSTTNVLRPYTNRWTRCTLTNVLSFANAHTANVRTTSQDPTLGSNEAAFNSGLNSDPTNGDVVAWFNIVPNAFGQIVVLSRQYTNGQDSTLIGTETPYKGYAIAGFRLEEFAGSLPVITTQPQSRTIAVGQNATLAVMVSGSPPLRYQWRKNGINLSGGTNSMLSLNSVNFSNSGNYSVAIDNAAGSAASAAAYLAVLSANTSMNLTGRVFNASGGPVLNATVTLSAGLNAYTQTNTDANGRYSFPALPLGVFALSASRAGLVSDQRVVTLSANLPPQDFRLTPFGTLPALQTANSTPPFILPPANDVEGAQLLVFNGTSFVPNMALLDTDVMTVVLTHGWIICGDNGGVNYWPSNMARTLRANGITSDKANIVAWDWYTAARPCFPPNPPEEKTPKHGVALGQALHQALGSGYRKRVHFLGHSLGALVNASAADHLHGESVGKVPGAQPSWVWVRTHMTLFDEAEIARAISKETFYDILGGYLTSDGVRVVLSAAKTVAGWKSPVPRQSRWADNYISAVGIYHSDAMNVCLQKGISLTPSIIAAHSYPQHWYSNSIARPTASVLGFRNSWEYQLLPAGSGGEFPPSQFPVGEAYRQTPNASDELVMEQVPYSRIYECFVPAVTVTAEIGAEYVVSEFVVPAVDASVAAARKVGHVTVEAGQWAATQVVNGVNTVVNAVSDTYTGVRQEVVDVLNRPGLNIYMTTGLPPLFGNLKGNNAGPVSSNTPAYLWLPIAVPSDAVAMVFDFTITGDGKDDSFAFGINGTNLFSLEAKFVDEGELSTTRLMDVSAYAGMTNEFFFGIMGGTSTNCAVKIEGIRFFTLALPALSITQTNGATLLSWPSSANGFVLEGSSSVSNPTWAAVTNTPTLFAGRFSMANLRTNEMRFFRLRR